MARRTGLPEDALDRLRNMALVAGEPIRKVAERFVESRSAEASPDHLSEPPAPP